MDDGDDATLYDLARKLNGQAPPDDGGDACRKQAEPGELLVCDRLMQLPRQCVDEDHLSATVECA